MSIKAIIASFVYISSAVIAVFPRESLKLIITVPFGTNLIPLSVTPKSEILSFVLLIYLFASPKSLIETHVFVPFQYAKLFLEGVFPI